MSTKYDWSIIDKFILDNPELTNEEVGVLFGAALSTISWRRNLLGVGKQEMEYWTPVQVKWLKRLYTYMGDYEIALIFNEAYPKKKGWTLKHIEKKRMYLGLNRSKEQLKQIRKRNYQFGSWAVNMQRLHEQRSEPVGTIKKWGAYSYIKSEDGFIRLMRHTWERANGPVPAGKIVVRKNMDLPENDLNNLELIGRDVLAQRNKLTQYPIELRNTIIALSQLNKTIYEKH